MSPRGAFLVQFVRKNILSEVELCSSRAESKTNLELPIVLRERTRIFPNALYFSALSRAQENKCRIKCRLPSFMPSMPSEMPIAKFYAELLGILFGIF